VRILTKMFMFLTDTTNTVFHADTMNTSSSRAFCQPFTRTQSTDVRWRRRHCLWSSRAMRKRRSSVFLKTPIGFSLPTAISTVHIGVKGQCPKDVQVWSARDTQVILYLYQSQGDYQTVHTQETTGTNGGEATSTFNNPKRDHQYL